MANTPFATCVLLFLIAGNVSLRISVNPEEKDLTLGEDKFWDQNMVIVPLVTGAGRGGTHSVAKFLNHVGIKAMHEGIAPNAVSVSWLYAPFGDKPYSKQDISAPFQDIQLLRNAWLSKWQAHLSEANQEDDPKLFSQLIFQENENQDVRIQFYPIIHIVRNPLQAIASLERCFCGGGNITSGAENDWKSWQFAERFVEPLGTARMRKAAIYWLKWHELSGRHATHTFRIEDINATQFVEALGKQTTIKDDFQSVKENESPSRLKNDLTWAQLSEAVGTDLTNEIMKQAVFFGYNAR